MARFVLIPHNKGFGHRVRCDTIGRGLLAFPDVASVHLLLRRDDSVLPSNWTTLPTTKSRFGRTFRILSANVLIEDGVALLNRRVRVMQRLGGKLVLVLQPTGFAPGSIVVEALRAADLILVPYPPELFELRDPLRDFREKVRAVAPIVAFPNLAKSRDHEVLVYCEVSRPLIGFERVITEACSLLAREVSLPVELAGGLGELRKLEEHLTLLARANVVVTQGITAAFEARSLGIPVVLVPRPDSPEQLVSAQEMAAASWAELVQPDDLTPSTLAAALSNAFRRGSAATIGDPNRSGLPDSIRYLRQVAELPNDEKVQPKVSFIATNFNCAHALERHLESIYSQWGMDEFEYILTDNYSDDESPSILREWAATHPNFRWTRVRCSVGMGRELASRGASAPFLLTVDTDTVYAPILRPFVERATSIYPTHAVQAIYAGVFPHHLWRISGGRGNFNVGEDFEMWMRLWRMGRMKWYPVRMGENLKDPGARDAADYLSARYRRLQKITRLLRREFDLLRLVRYEAWDSKGIWKSNTVDLGFGTIQDTWFGDSPRGGLRKRAAAFVRAVWEILES